MPYEHRLNSVRDVQRAPSGGGLQGAVAYAKNTQTHLELTGQGSSRARAPSVCGGGWPRPLRTQAHAQAQVQLEKLHSPMKAKGGAGPDHHQGRHQATKGAEGKEKWAYCTHVQRKRPPSQKNAAVSERHQPEQPPWAR